MVRARPHRCVRGAASVALIVIQVVIFLVWPTQRSTRGFFEMLLGCPLWGLHALDPLHVVSNLPAYLLYFALAVVLFWVSRSAVVIAPPSECSG